ncbi:MAG: hypothetical protein IJ242_11075 [Clostridia bacterium]|nr:hypothetical protein [Clostridia bacterium]
MFFVFRLVHYVIYCTNSLNPPKTRCILFTLARFTYRFLFHCSSITAQLKLPYHLSGFP